MWYAPFGNHVARGVNEAECGKCEITYDRSKIEDDATRAVVIHFNEINPSTMPTPAQRKPGQMHIFWTMESPPSLKVLRGRTLEYEDRYGFNATMSHRRDSDFLTPYGHPWQSVQYFRTARHPDLNEIMKSKSKLALALISNCGGSARLKLVKDIINTGFKLEAYGACFPGRGGFPRGGDFEQRVRSYKFFFAFENSLHCRDYITEKFFRNGLRGDAVPVVWGAAKADYVAIAPPHSFVHVEDFPTVQALVDYLNYLDKNDTAYREYFRWHEMGDASEAKLRTDGFCEICRALHGINAGDIDNPKYGKNWPRPLIADRVYPRSVSLRKWYYEEEDPVCLRVP